MIIPCIDLMDGKVVQLVQGREKALEGGSPDEMLQQFSAFPVIQVIEVLDDPPEVADPIPVAVREAPGIDLVDDPSAPPVIVVGSRFRGDLRWIRQCGMVGRSSGWLVGI